MKFFFNTLVGNINSGRLSRLQYFKYSIFWLIFSMALLLVTVLAIGASESLLGGNFQQTKEQLLQWLTVPITIIFALSGLFLFYVGFNLMIKRIRDIGLPAWPIAIVITLLSVGINYIFNKGQGMDLLVWLALVFIPSNTFGDGTK